MAKCVICGKDSGKAECCSAACRAKKSRRTRTVRKEAHAGEIDVRTLAMVDAACGDKLTHGLRDQLKGLTHSIIPDQRVIPLEVIPNGKDMTIDSKGQLRPAHYGQLDCECRMCKTNRAHGGKHTINHGPYKTVAQLGTGEFNRVSLPGDVDYIQMKAEQG